MVGNRGELQVRYGVTGVGYGDARGGILHIQNFQFCSLHDLIYTVQDVR